MNGFKIWALQDLSHMLPVKYMQHETHVRMNIIKRGFWSLFNSSREEREKHARESKIINSPKLSNGVESIFTTQMTSSDIATIILGTRSPIHFLNFETNTRMKDPKALPGGNPADDDSFMHGDRNVTANKIDGCASKIVSTLRESQEPTFDDTIEQVRTDNLSTVIAARNMNALPSVKSESKTSGIEQQRSLDRFKSSDDQYSQEYDISSQSRELQDYTREDSVSNTTVRVQQRSRIARCISRTSAIISEPLLSSFEILEQSNTTKRCAKDTREASAIFAKIEIPRNISLKWSSMKQPCLRREYHTWKISPGIENDIKRDDVFASDTRAAQREQSTRYGSSQFHGLTCFGSTGNQGSRNPSSCPSFVPRRDFSSKSCAAIQSSVRKIETARNDMFNANLSSIIRLRSISLTKLQFSCDASKKSSEEKDGSKSQQRSGYKVKDSCSRKIAKDRDKGEKRCEKTRKRKDARDRVTSRDDTCEKQKSKSESCERTVCPKLQMRRCNWERKEEERPEEDRKERVAKRDPKCSQKEEVVAKCSKRQRSKSCTRRKDYERLPLVVCKNLAKRKSDCRESKSDEKKQSKCSESDQRRSESCQKRKPSRSSGDKNCGKIDGKRHYSQQSIFSISRVHRSFSTLIPDIRLDTDVRNTTYEKAFYSSCGKDEKKDVKQGPSCEKPRKKCETAKKDEAKKKCVKGPAKCMSRKSIVDKTQTCQSTKDEDKKLKIREPTQKSCSHAEYCANRKIEPITKDKKPMEKATKAQPPITVKDKKPMDESIKKQIEREYKEINECKKQQVIEKKEKKSEIKKDCTKYKLTNLNSLISLRKQEDIKTNEIFRNMLNKPIVSNSIAYKMLSILSSVINSEISIIPKDTKLLNVMFDRSFSTTKVSYQDDFAIKRTADHSKMIQNYSANNSDFIHGDELPNYIEIENDDEEEDEYDWIVDRPTSGIN